MVGRVSRGERLIRSVAMSLFTALLIVSGVAADPLPQIRKNPHDTEALRRDFVGNRHGRPYRGLCRARQ